jgi:hypothetical protein
VLGKSRRARRAAAGGAFGERHSANLRHQVTKSVTLKNGKRFSLVYPV